MKKHLKVLILLKILTKEQINFIKQRLDIGGTKMTATVEPTVEWSQDKMVEVILNEPDDFLKVRETLTRIGVASRKEKKLYQSCHILHKQGRYYIVHFKELFLHWMVNMPILRSMMYSAVIASLAYLLIGVSLQS